MSSYSLGDAARILKVSPARLRYWERTELLQRQGEGELFDFRDLACLRGILSLLEQGVPLRRIRRNVEVLRERLPQIDDPVRALRLWVDGSERMVVRHEGVLIEPDGQMVLDFGGEEAEAERVTAISASSIARARQRAEAEACFEEGCRLDADPATYADALKAYRRSIELDPELADSHCNLGAVHYNRGERGKARACFERCLQIDLHHVEANFNLANMLEEEGADQLALQHYRVALAADPHYPDLHINLALLYEKLGFPRQAGRHWRRYLQLDADGAWAEVARQRLAREE